MNQPFPLWTHEDPLSRAPSPRTEWFACQNETIHSFFEGNWTYSTPNQSFVAVNFLQETLFHPFILNGCRLLIFMLIDLKEFERAFFSFRLSCLINSSIASNANQSLKSIFQKVQPFDGFVSWSVLFALLMSMFALEFLWVFNLKKSCIVPVKLSRWDKLFKCWLPLWFTKASLTVLKQLIYFLVNFSGELFAGHVVGTLNVLSSAFIFACKYERKYFPARSIEIL